MGLCQDAGSDGGGDQRQYAARFPGYALSMRPLLGVRVLERRGQKLFPLSDVLLDDVLLDDVLLDGVPISLLDTLPHDRYPLGLV